MSPPKPDCYRLRLLAVTAMLGGCSGLQPQAGTPGAIWQSHANGLGATHATSWSAQEMKSRKNLIYVADGGKVWIFPAKRNSAPIASITDGITSANGLYVDRGGSLYVANYVFDNSSVTAYAVGSLTPSVTYSEDLDRPLYPIIDSKGNLFVSNAGNGTVVEYLNGSTSAYQVLQTGGTEADGIDFDRKGNLYVAYRNGSYASIEKFAPGSIRGKSLGMQLSQPQGLIVANDGTILVVETGRANRIDEFLPTKKTPKLEIDVPGTPVQLAITETENTLFVSTLRGAIYVAPYPLEGPRLRQEVFGGYDTQGVALSNGQFFQ